MISLTPRACPNCGAPVRGAECDYCGSVFERDDILTVRFDYDYLSATVPLVSAVCTTSNSTAAFPRTVRYFNPINGTYEWR